MEVCVGEADVAAAAAVVDVVEDVAVSLEDEDAEEEDAEDEDVLDAEAVELSVAVPEDADVSVELGLAEAAEVVEAEAGVEPGVVEESVGVVVGLLAAALDPAARVLHSRT